MIRRFLQWIKRLFNKTKPDKRRDDANYPMW